MVDVMVEEDEWIMEKPSERSVQVQKKRLRNLFIRRTGKALSDKGTQFKAVDIIIPLFI